MGRYGITGLQYRGQGNGIERNLEVKKSWFFLGDEIVCLGSGITSPTGNPIETTVDNKRIADSSHTTITVNGVTYPFGIQASGMHKIKSLHLTGNCGSASDIGYVFPQETDVRIVCEHRVGTWNTITVNPANQKENDFATFVIPHGEKPENASYAYTILPCKSAKETTAYEAAPQYRIVENSTEAHAVRHTNGILGINFWNAASYTCAGITSNTQASVMISASEISVCDPTQSDAIIELRFDFDADVTDKDDAVTVLSLSPLKVSVNTKGKSGGSSVLRIKRRA